jgi:uncharacterized protein (TIGR03086 family)
MIFRAGERFTFEARQQQRRGGRDMNPDLTPATEMLAKVVAGIGDDQLGAPTPCHGGTVAGLLDHVNGLCLAFTGAAVKDLEAGSQAPVVDASRLAPDWRERIPERLARLAAAWSNEDAWAGMTRAGGLDMPAEVTGRVAANEVVVHGWDLAVATGQDYACDAALLQAAYEFVQGAVAENPDGTPGLFGPPVTVPGDAPRLDQHLGLTGRDPAWRPGR